MDERAEVEHDLDHLAVKNGAIGLLESADADVLDDEVAAEQADGETADGEVALEIVGAGAFGAPRTGGPRSTVSVVTNATASTIAMSCSTRFRPRPTSRQTERRGAGVVAGSGGSGGSGPSSPVEPVERV